MQSLDIILRDILSNQQVVWLMAAIGANLILGIVASIRTKDFHCTALADWLTTRVIPLIGGYVAASLIAWANPQLVVVRDAAFATLSLTLLGYVFANLRDIGVPVPDAIAAKPSGPMVTHVTVNAPSAAAGAIAREVRGVLSSFGHRTTVVVPTDPTPVLDPMPPTPPTNN